MYDFLILVFRGISMGGARTTSAVRGPFLNTSITTSFCLSIISFKFQIELYQVFFSFGLVLSPEPNLDCSSLLTGGVPEAKQRM
jgi:hypothetical protein